MRNLAHGPIGKLDSNLLCAHVLQDTASAAQPAATCVQPRCQRLFPILPKGAAGPRRAEADVEISTSARTGFRSLFGCPNWETEYGGPAVLASARCSPVQ